MELRRIAGLFLKNALNLFFKFPSNNQLQAKIICDKLIKNLDTGIPITKIIKANI